MLWASASFSSAGDFRRTVFPSAIRIPPPRRYPVSDLAAAKAVYAALLGVASQADESYYVGFEAAGQHIGLVPGGGPQGMTSPVAYWHVLDIEAKLAEVTAAGATVKEPAHHVSGGRLVATSEPMIATGGADGDRYSYH
jgi:predicted enzyme related to lactoylglutathione lyase